ncbi:hypothetical protein BGX28_005025 [Mortierella sp. GBA30]|nr:hypothetical protein BGX28_005025 [Mortierella sp. GBA30]
MSSARGPISRHLATKPQLVHDSKRTSKEPEANPEVNRELEPELKVLYGTSLDNQERRKRMRLMPPSPPADQNPFNAPTIQKLETMFDRVLALAKSTKEAKKKKKTSPTLLPSSPRPSSFSSSTSSLSSSLSSSSWTPVYPSTREHPFHPYHAQRRSLHYPNLNNSNNKAEGYQGLKASQPSYLQGSDNNNKSSQDRFTKQQQIGPSTSSRSVWSTLSGPSAEVKESEHKTTSDYRYLLPPADAKKYDVELSAPSSASQKAITETSIMDRSSQLPSSSSLSRNAALSQPQSLPIERTKFLDTTDGRIGDSSGVVELLSSDGENEAEDAEEDVEDEPFEEIDNHAGEEEHHYEDYESEEEYEEEPSEEEEVEDQEERLMEVVDLDDDDEETSEHEREDYMRRQRNEQNRLMRGTMGLPKQLMPETERRSSEEMYTLNGSSDEEQYSQEEEEEEEHEEDEYPEDDEDEGAEAQSDVDEDDEHEEENVESDIEDDGLVPVSSPSFESRSLGEDAHVSSLHRPSLQQSQSADASSRRNVEEDYATGDAVVLLDSDEEEAQEIEEPESESAVFQEGHGTYNQDEDLDQDLYEEDEEEDEEKYISDDNAGDDEGEQHQIELEATNTFGAEDVKEELANYGQDETQNVEERAFDQENRELEAGTLLAQQVREDISLATVLDESIQRLHSAEDKAFAEHLQAVNQESMEMDEQTSRTVKEDHVLEPAAPMHMDLDESLEERHDVGSESTGEQAIGPMVASESINIPGTSGIADTVPSEPFMQLENAMAIDFLTAEQDNAYEEEYHDQAPVAISAMESSSSAAGMSDVVMTMDMQTTDASFVQETIQQSMIDAASLQGESMGVTTSAQRETVISGGLDVPSFDQEQESMTPQFPIQQVSQGQTTRSSREYNPDHVSLLERLRAVAQEEGVSMSSFGLLQNQSHVGFFDREPISLVSTGDHIRQELQQQQQLPEEVTLTEEPIATATPLHRAMELGVTDATELSPSSSQPRKTRLARMGTMAQTVMEGKAFIEQVEAKHGNSRASPQSQQPEQPEQPERPQQEQEEQHVERIDDLQWTAPSGAAVLTLDDLAEHASVAQRAATAPVFASSETFATTTTTTTASTVVPTPSVRRGEVALLVEEARAFCSNVRTSARAGSSPSTMVSSSSSKPAINSSSGSISMMTTSTVDADGLEMTAGQNTALVRGSSSPSRSLGFARRRVSLGMGMDHDKGVNRSTSISTDEQQEQQQPQQQQQQQQHVLSSSISSNPSSSLFTSNASSFPPISMTPRKSGVVDLAAEKVIQSTVVGSHALRPFINPPSPVGSGHHLGSRSSSQEPSAVVSPQKQHHHQTSTFSFGQTPFGLVSPGSSSTTTGVGFGFGSSFVMTTTTTPTKEKKPLVSLSPKTEQLMATAVMSQQQQSPGVQEASVEDRKLVPAAGQEPIASFSDEAKQATEAEGVKEEDGEGDEDEDEGDEEGSEEADIHHQYQDDQDRQDQQQQQQPGTIFVRKAKKKRSPSSTRTKNQQRRAAKKLLKQQSA